MNSSKAISMLFIILFVWAYFFINSAGKISSISSNEDSNELKKINIKHQQQYNVATNPVNRKKTKAGVINFSDKEIVYKSQEVKKPAENSNNLDELISDPENVKWMAKYNEIKKQFISKDFKNTDQWENAFEIDQNSEWGVDAEEEYRKRIYDDNKWDSREAHFDAVECKTHFCKLTFSFDSNTNSSVRRSFYPDLMTQDGPDKMRKYFVHYDKNTQLQTIYMERCMSCE